MNILFSLTTFTILWATAAIKIYFLLLKNLDEAQKLKERAAEEYRKAAEEKEKASKFFEDCLRSLHSLN